MHKDFIQIDCMCKNTCTILRINRLVDKIRGKELYKYWLQVYPSYKMPSKYLWWELNQVDMLILTESIQQLVCGDIVLNKRNMWLDIVYDPMVHTFSIRLYKKMRCIWEVVMDEKECGEIRKKLTEWIKPISPYPDYE